MGYLYRDYSTENSRFEIVYQTYMKMISNQTMNYVNEKKNHFNSFPQQEYSIWEVCNMMNEIVDESDPDTDLPQIIHCYQTALSISSRYFDSDLKLKQNISIQSLFSNQEYNELPQEVKQLYNSKQYLHNLFPHIQDWDWMILAGFMHDIGKVLALPKWGQLPQWSVVGDIFPVGCNYDQSNIFSEDNIWKQSNPDAKQNMYKSQLGVYQMNCGFENVHFSFGHDEYLAAVFRRSNSMGMSKLPREMIYMINFHSFYAWHSPRKHSRGYTYLASKDDWLMLPLLKALKLADLYSKSRNVPNMDILTKQYDGLMNKYFANARILM